MPRRDVAEIVDQGTKAGEDLRSLPAGSRLLRARGSPPFRKEIVRDSVQLTALGRDDPQQPLRHPVGAKAVREAGVGRARVDEMRVAELTNPAQPLKRARVDYRDLELVEMDVSVDGIGALSLPPAR